MRIFTASILSIGFLLTACTGGPHVVLRSPDGDKVKVTIEIADDPEERKTGLMNRTELAENHGMLFVFEREQRLSFWMKNTLIPLDIIYFDAEKQFVSRARMVPCREEPCRSYPSAGSAQYALEVPAGFVAEHRIERGWKFDLKE